MNYILPRKLSVKLRADYIGLLVQFLLNGYAMLMRPNKAETGLSMACVIGTGQTVGWRLSVSLAFIVVIATGKILKLCKT